MRVADRMTARNYLKYLHGARSAYADTLSRINSGKRFTKLSDDVSAGTRVLTTRTEMYKTEKHLNNVKAINEELTVTEECMQSISDIIGDVHKLVIRAKNDPTSTGGRKAIAQEMRGLRDEVLQFCNTQYGKRFVFGGTNMSSAPFTLDENGRALYNGVPMDEVQKDPDTGEFFYMKPPVQPSNKQPGDPGYDPDVVPDPNLPNYDPDDPTHQETKVSIPMDEDVYMDIGLGFKMKASEVQDTTAFKISYSGLDFLGFGTDEDGTSNNVYNIIHDIMTNIETYSQEELEEVDDRLTALSDKFRANLTDIGSKTNYLDTMQTRLQQTEDNQKIRIQNLMGIDDAEEATNQSMNDYVLKAVLQMGSRILPVSLMDYLR